MDPMGCYARVTVCVHRFKTTRGPFLIPSWTIVLSTVAAVLQDFRQGSLPHQPGDIGDIIWNLLHAKQTELRHLPKDL